MCCLERFISTCIYVSIKLHFFFKPLDANASSIFILVRTYILLERCWSLYYQGVWMKHLLFGPSLKCLDRDWKCRSLKFNILTCWCEPSCRSIFTIVQDMFYRKQPSVSRSHRSQRTSWLVSVLSCLSKGQISISFLTPIDFV